MLHFLTHFEENADLQAVFQIFSPATSWDPGGLL